MDQTLMKVCEVNPNDGVSPQRGDIPVSVKIDGRASSVGPTRISTLSGKPMPNTRSDPAWLLS
jgi:hypothetical protein